MHTLRVVITKIDVGVDSAGIVTKNETLYQAYAPDGELIVAGTETDLIIAGMSTADLQSAIDDLAYQRWIAYLKNLSHAEQIQATVDELSGLVNQDITVVVPDIPAIPVIVQADDKIIITADSETATIETFFIEMSEATAPLTYTWNGTPIEESLGEGDFEVTAIAINVRGGRSASATLNFSYTAPV